MDSNLWCSRLISLKFMGLMVFIDMPGLVLSLWMVCVLKSENIILMSSSSYRQ